LRANKRERLYSGAPLSLWNGIPGSRIETLMGDDFPVFGQLSQLNPSGSTRNSKEVPVDKDSRRRQRKGKGKRGPETIGEDPELEDGEGPQKDKTPVGKVVDITI